MSRRAIKGSLALRAAFQGWLEANGAFFTLEGIAMLIELWFDGLRGNSAQLLI